MRSKNISLRATRLSTLWFGSLAGILIENNRFPPMH